MIFSRVRFTRERNNFLLPWNIRVTRWLIDEGTGVGIEFVWPTWSLQIPLVGIESTLLYTHTSRLDRREQRHRKCSRARKKMDSSDDKNLRARFLDLLTSSWTHARLISMEIILSKKWEKFLKIRIEEILRYNFFNEVEVVFYFTNDVDFLSIQNVLSLYNIAFLHRNIYIYIYLCCSQNVFSCYI